MPYLNIDLDYPNHPKTIRFAGEIGGHRSELIPLLLWIHAGKYHQEDGHLKGYSPAALAKIVGWKDNPEKLVNALLNCGFIEQKKDGYQVHDFLEHNGHLTVFRERARNAAKTRWEKAKNNGKPAQDSKPTEKAGKKSSAIDSVLTENQISDVLRELSKSCKCGITSTALQVAWSELSRKLEKAFKTKNIDNKYGYAISAAKNYGVKA